VIRNRIILPSPFHGQLCESVVFCASVSVTSVLLSVMFWFVLLSVVWGATL
jgi:hypothetical protein